MRWLGIFLGLTTAAAEVGINENGKREDGSEKYSIEKKERTDVCKK